MRSNGLATVLLMVPVLSVPALAIFGIPQFAPVVASPLDEGSDFDREPRSGNSSRQSSHDDQFGDVDEVPSDADMNDEQVPKKRKSSLVTSANRSSRRLKTAAAPSWSDDLNEAADSSVKRRNSPAMLDDLSDQDSIPVAKGPKKNAVLEKMNRDKQRPGQTVKNDEAIRVVSAADLDRGFSPPGFDEAGSQPAARSNSNDDRMRGNDPRRSRRREAAEPMSWATAVERLNQLDVRNFRLEPGSQLGQFIFICVYTSPDNPGITHRFEAEAEQPLKAVENVLEQIVEWQQRR